jgi:hypothetical protein
MDLVFAPSQIETWPLERLRPYARNAKIHGTNQVAKIAASMAKFGWTVPCMVADDRELIAGHGRILAAAHLGLTEAPVIVLGHLTDPNLTVSEWADQHRKMSSRASAEPGQYRTAGTPCLREIMDALSPRHPARHGWTSTMNLDFPTRSLTGWPTTLIAPNWKVIR